MPFEFVELKLLCFAISCFLTDLLKQQLQALMETLSLTEPHYIRCIKPNSLNRPQKFENQSVLHQLRCGVSIVLVILYVNC